MKFLVKASDSQGRDHDVLVDAADEKSAVAAARAQGFFAFDISPAPDEVVETAVPSAPQDEESSSSETSTEDPLKSDRNEPRPEPAAPASAPEPNRTADAAAAGAPESDDTISCIACGSRAVQLVSVTKRDVGAALFGELLGGTSVGVTAGRKSVVLNTCMKCGAQWVPGTSKTLAEIEKAKRADTATLLIVAVIGGALVWLLGLIIIHS